MSTQRRRRAGETEDDRPGERERKRRRPCIASPPQHYTGLPSTHGFCRLRPFNHRLCDANNSQNPSLDVTKSSPDVVKSSPGVVKSSPGVVDSSPGVVESSSDVTTPRHDFAELSHRF